MAGDEEKLKAWIESLPENDRRGVSKSMLSELQERLHQVFIEDAKLENKSEIGKKNESGLHTTFVTNVDVYDNSAAVAYGPTSNGRGRLDYDRITDTKLRIYFEKCKEIEDNYPGEDEKARRQEYGNRTSQVDEKFRFVRIINCQS